MISWLFYRWHYLSSHFGLIGVHPTPVIQHKRQLVRGIEARRLTKTLRGESGASFCDRNPSRGCATIHGQPFLWTLQQPTNQPSVNIRLYSLTNRRCLYNETSSRQHITAFLTAFSLVPEQKTKTHCITLIPLARNLLMFYRFAVLLFCRAAFLLCSLFGYPNAQIFVIVVGSCWSRWVAEVYVAGTAIS